MRPESHLPHLQNSFHQTALRLNHLWTNGVQLLRHEDIFIRRYFERVSVHVRKVNGPRHAMIYRHDVLVQCLGEMTDSVHEDRSRHAKRNGRARRLPRLFKQSENDGS